MRKATAKQEQHQLQNYDHDGRYFSNAVDYDGPPVPEGWFVAWTTDRGTIVYSFWRNDDGPVVH